MPFLIDGHNLIPKMGLRLDEFDDELMLIDQLNEFCRLSRRGQMEVYFDNAPAGHPATRKVGLVTAHFVRKPLIADEAIHLRLMKLKKAAKNWTVISSDHRVQVDAKSAGAAVISSDEFARLVIETLRNHPPASGSGKGMSERDLEEWLKLFENKKDKKFGQF